MIDILGTIYTQPTYDDQGEIITPPEPLPGYHVNTVCLVPAFEPFTIDTPSHPARLFGDIAHTVFLRFQDRAEWLSLGIEQEDGTFDTSALQAELDKLRWRKTADCTRLQAELALQDAGMFDAVEAWISDPATPAGVKSAYNRAYRFSRNSELFNSVKTAMSLTDEQIDDLFRLAQSKSV